MAARNPPLPAAEEKEEEEEWGDGWGLYPSINNNTNAEKKKKKGNWPFTFKLTIGGYKEKVRIKTEGFSYFFLFLMATGEERAD